MNEKFFELSNEKRTNIINAAMEVFGKHEYKRAVTDEIASKAGISKGLLFYYFHNKKELYIYVCQYCFELMKTLVIDEHFDEITDFFDLMTYGANKKVELLHKHPAIMEFVMRAYYSKNESISDDVNKDVQSELGKSYETYFKNIDFSKFKEDVDPQYIFQMLVWMSDGYLHELQKSNQPIDLEQIMIDFNKWKEIFRTIIYKEEFV